MAVVLHVDGPRWRAHLEQTLAHDPGLVPVVKGNGYGFGLETLLAECTRLHAGGLVDLVAVGTYAEARLAIEAFPGSVLVLEPYRAVLHAGLDHLGSTSIVHTLASRTDLAELTSRVATPRVVLEGLTSMNRHGMPAPELSGVLANAAASGGPHVVGATLHFPLAAGSGHGAELSSWLDAALLDTWFVSHLSAGELASARTARPGLAIRSRVGTRLWLGDPGALSVRADVLDIRTVRSGDRAGYRQRRLRGGYLMVVSGGTAHGVAMEAPSAASTARQRAVAVAEGILEAAGRVRSPFTVDGRRTWFVEPPHMQVSLVSLGEDTAPPRVGDEVEVRVRHTTLHADTVVVS